MAWRWELRTVDGSAWQQGGGDQEFPSQADAESWLGESWRQLRDHGVGAVVLFEDGRQVYGPMSLADGG